MRAWVADELVRVGVELADERVHEAGQRTLICVGHLDVDNCKVEVAAREPVRAGVPRGFNSTRAARARARSATF